MKNEKVAKGRIIGLAGPCFRKDPYLMTFDDNSICTERQKKKERGLETAVPKRMKR